MVVASIDGGGGGAAWTPVQLQDDVDVRVVVHRRGAAATRAFFGLDLTLITHTKVCAGYNPTQNIESKPGRGRAGPRVYSSSGRLEFSRKPELITIESAPSRLSSS